MNYDFDRLHNFIGTNSLKWEHYFDGKESHYTDRTRPIFAEARWLAMWVADMDFATAPPIIAALTARVQRGIFGYAKATAPYYEAVEAWLTRRYGFTPQRDWFVLTPGVVPALSMLLQALLQPGDKVLIQRPVYYPFFDVIRNNGAEIVSSSLVLEDSVYRMDFEDLARKAVDPAVRTAILCSPHNPVGRVWTREELLRFATICHENDVLVLADELHADLLFPGETFVSWGSLGREILQRSVICTAATKSFNLAGLKVSNIIVPDTDLRQRLQAVITRHALYNPQALALVATEAAYRDGEPWLNAVMAYVADNYRYLVDFLAAHLPQLRVIRPQGTYLVWVDFRALGLPAAERKRLIMDDAGLLLDEGELFGPEGAGFERFNLACPRAILEEALLRLQRVLG
jgi:cystathionine beta-lyase